MNPAARKLKDWRENPRQFVWDNFKADPDPWQGDVLDAFASGDADKQRISMQAAAGVGKSSALAWCGWNFLSCYGAKGEHPKAAALSITGANLRDNLWSEFAKWQSKSDFLLSMFEWNQERIFCRDFPSTWFMSARGFSKAANPDEQGRSLSGLHSKYILYLIDESGDISPNVLKSAEQGLSTGPLFGKILQAGNPTSLDGMLYAAATTLRNMWQVINITGDPKDPKRSTRIDIEWAREQIQRYGEENPWVMSFILGKFPPGSINSLFGVDEVTAAMGKHLVSDQYSFSQKRIGVDVARFGSDRTVLFPRQGLASFNPIILRDARTPEIASRVAVALTKWECDWASVDSTGGFGAGVVDSLLQAGHSPLEVHFSGKAADERYLNKRAEMWFRMRDWLRRGGALPRIPELVRELTSPTYTFVNGRFQLEPKEQIKKRLGYSPDLADALCLTFSEVELPASFSVNGVAVSRKDLHQSEYDPYAEDRL